MLFAAQFTGATLGFGLFRIMVPSRVYDLTEKASSAGVCSTALGADVSELLGVFIEFIATGILILLCCSVWDPRNAAQTHSAAMKFGFAITGLALAFVSRWPLQFGCDVIIYLNCHS